MSQMITVFAKEGTSVEIDEATAHTSKYLDTVLKDEPGCKEIRTNIPYKFLQIAKQFCLCSLLFVMYSGLSCK